MSDPVKAKPRETGSRARNKTLALNVGPDGHVKLTPQDQALLKEKPSTGNGYSVVVTDNRPLNPFLLPSIFTAQEDAPICTSVGGSERCIGIVLAKSSPLPHLTGAAESLADSLNPDRKKDPTLRTLDDLNADYYFLKQVALGRLKLTKAQEIFLRRHAAKVAMTRRDATVLANAGAIEVPDSCKIGDKASVSLSSDSDLLFGNPEETIFDGVRQTISKEVSCADRAMAEHILKDADLKAVLKIELHHTRKRIQETLTKASEDSYYDHKGEIADLSKIDDPHKLAKAVAHIKWRIGRGLKLQKLQDAASAIGSSAKVGKRTINLDEQIYKLSKTEDDDALRRGILAMRKDFKVVSLAQGLEGLVTIAKQLLKRSEDIFLAAPDADTTKCEVQGYDGMQAECKFGDSLAAGKINRERYRSYLKKLIKDAKAARGILNAGSEKGAAQWYKNLVNDTRFKTIAKHIQNDLQTTDRGKLAITVYIIIGAGCVAGIAGAYVSTGLVASGMAGSLATIAGLSVEAAVFVGLEKTMRWAVFGEKPYDPNKGIVDNAMHLHWEGIKAMGMFGSVKTGMKGAQALARRVILRRAMRKMIRDGVIKYASEVGMGEKAAKQLQKYAMLGWFGQTVQHMGMFGAEYATFTVWDYFIQSVELSHKKGEFTTPDNFFTGEAFYERFVFLGCLKIGGFLAKPFTQGLQAKTSAIILKKFRPQIERHDKEYKAVMSELRTHEISGETNPKKVAKLYGRLKMLLKQRYALEKKLGEIDPELAENTSKTLKELDRVKHESKAVKAMAIVERGTYGKAERAQLIDFLDQASKPRKVEGKKVKLLTYKVKSDGTIKITFNDAHKSTREIVPQGKAAPKVKTPQISVTTSGTGSVRRVDGAYILTDGNVSAKIYYDTASKQWLVTCTEGRGVALIWKPSADFIQYSSKAVFRGEAKPISEGQGLILIREPFRIKFSSGEKPAAKRGSTPGPRFNGDVNGKPTNAASGTLAGAEASGTQIIERLLLAKETSLDFSSSKEVVGYFRKQYGEENWSKIKFLFEDSPSAHEKIRSLRKQVGELAGGVYENCEQLSKLVETVLVRNGIDLKGMKDARFNQLFTPETFQQAKQLTARHEQIFGFLMVNRLIPDDIPVYRATGETHAGHASQDGVSYWGVGSVGRNVAMKYGSDSRLVAITTLGTLRKTGAVYTDNIAFAGNRAAIELHHFSDGKGGFRTYNYEVLSSKTSPDGVGAYR